MEIKEKQREKKPGCLFHEYKCINCNSGKELVCQKCIKDTGL